MKIVIAYEWRYKEKHWLHKLLEEAGYEVCIVDMHDVDRRAKLKKWHKIVELKDYFLMARKARQLLEPGDVFIGWCFTTAVFASILNKQDNLIIGLNILMQDKQGPGSRLRNYLYRKAFENKNFRATGNTENGINIALSIVGEQYADRFTVMHDVLLEEGHVNAAYGDYCFSGGASGRDWKTLIKAAELCPDISFRIIAGSGSWDNSLTLPANVECSFDVTEEAFTEALKNSRMVVLPLVSEVTSGLLVLFQAINCGKPFIASNTDAVKYYVPEQLQSRYLVSIGDYEALADKIRNSYNHIDKQDIEEIYNFNQARDMKSDYMEKLEGLIRSAQHAG